MANADSYSSSDDANAITTDIVASNGVIHVIDSVIVPQQSRPLEEAILGSPTPGLARNVRLVFIAGKDTGHLLGSGGKERRRYGKSLTSCDALRVESTLPHVVHLGRESTRSRRTVWQVTGLYRLIQG
jgi:hypothetical protein